MRSFVRASLEDASAASAEVPALGPVEVIDARSGFDAMRLLPRTRYDLVITDINMPDVNGLELIRFMRKSAAYRTTPLLIISTQATPRDVERGKQLGADAYLGKPFTPEDLRGTCARLFETSDRMQQENPEVDG